MILAYFNVILQCTVNVTEQYQLTWHNVYYVNVFGEQVMEYMVGDCFPGLVFTGVLKMYCEGVSV